MVTLSALAENFETSERPAGNLLDGPSVLAQAIAATRQYAGYAKLVAYESVAVAPELSGDTSVSNSEWAVIKPLFMLYVERETALQLEASRGLGMDVYGRSSSEVANDITQYEAELPRLAFFFPIITV